MRISVIATGYNCEAYAKECIESVLAQTYKNFELLIYNDGSTDDTAQICTPYVDSKNVWLMNNEKNISPLYGRYTLMRVATGDVICFLGLDDMLAPNALEKVAEAYQNEDVKMTWGAWVSYCGRHRSNVEQYPKEVWKNKSFRTSKWRATSLNTFKKELLLKVPKSVLQFRGKWFQNCTDLAYSFPCLELIEEHNTHLIHEPIYIYRIHENSTRNRLGINNKTRVREYLKTIPCLS